MCDLVVLGCGTAGVACLRELARDPLSRRLRSVTLVDRARIREANAITCPPYAGHEGCPKSERLSELAAGWLGGDARLTWLLASVESLPWRQLIAGAGAGSGTSGSKEEKAGLGTPHWMERLGGPSNEGFGQPHYVVDRPGERKTNPAEQGLFSSVPNPAFSSGGAMIALIGLDDWDSRLCAIEDLRRVASEAPAGARLAGALAIQVGLERGQAQVSVFGPLWDDPCPACGLSVLPRKEPCVALDGEGRLLRGDLQREARAAALLVREIVADCLTAGTISPQWVNTKTNLWAAEGAEDFQRLTHRGRRCPSCLGPHSPNTPLRWDVPSPAGAARDATAGHRARAAPILRPPQDGARAVSPGVPSG